MPLFSIVTVCLNDLQNLQKTAASVVKQDFDGYEYIILDGGSTDGTFEYLHRLGADRYLSESDDGIFHAMNKALKMCTGEFICFLNAGDLFPSSDILSRVAESIKSNPDTHFFYGDVYYKDSSGPYSIQPNHLTSFRLFRGTICHQAWYLKADVYQALGGFDTHLKYKGDYDALLRAFHLLKVTYLHLPFCVVNYKGGGYSENTFHESRPEAESVRRKYISPWQANLFSFVLSVLNPVKKSHYYQHLMAQINHWKAARSWAGLIDFPEMSTHDE